MDHHCQSLSTNGKKVSRATSTSTAPTSHPGPWGRATLVNAHHTAVQRDGIDGGAADHQRVGFCEPPIIL